MTVNEYSTPYAGMTLYANTAQTFLSIRSDEGGDLQPWQAANRCSYTAELRAAPSPFPEETLFYIVYDLPDQGPLYLAGPTGGDFMALTVTTQADLSASWMVMRMSDRTFALKNAATGSYISARTDGDRQGSVCMMANASTAQDSLETWCCSDGSESRLTLINASNATKDFFGSDADLSQDPGWNDAAVALNVIAGTWIAHVDTNFGGHSAILAPGQYSNSDLVDKLGLAHSSTSGAISSLRLLPDPDNSPTILLFSKSDYGGDMRVIKGTIDFVACNDDWNDRTRSIVVLSGNWALYQDRNFGGDAKFYGADEQFDDRGVPTPVYDLEGVLGYDHSPGFGVSCVQVYPPPSYFHGWMEGVPDSASLADLTIPGTHDSGTSNVSTVFSWTQDLDIAGQLNAGIRYLDIRCKLGSDGTLSITHGIESCHITFGDVLSACQGFLTGNRSECIILSIKNSDNPKLTDTNALKAFADALDAVLQVNSGSFYCQEEIPNLGDVRGKIVLFRQFDLTDPPPAGDWGIPASAGWGTPERECFTIPIPGGQIIGQDAYKVPFMWAFNHVGDITNKWNNILALFDMATSNPSPSPKTLFVNYTSGAGILLVPTPYAIARGTIFNTGINHRLYEWLLDDAGTARLGIVAVDFPTHPLPIIERLIARNPSKGGTARPAVQTGGRASMSRRGPALPAPRGAREAT